MRRRAFTLIEVLLAVALLTLVASAAVSWAVAQRRSGALIEERYEQLQRLIACRQAIREDLILAVADTTPPRPDEQGRLGITTVRALPEDEPGRSEVVWHFDSGQRALVRTTKRADGDRPRLALPELSAARFVQDDHRGLLLEIHPVAGPSLSVVVRGGP